jgi:arylsulfatase A-like enzyme
MQRRTFLTYAIASSLAVTLRGTAQGSRKPANVLMICIDDLNDWLGSLGGHPQALTPNLDRLAQQGTLFRNAHCAIPACNPSRVALLTGIAPHRSGVYASRHDWRAVLPEAVTLPELFKRSGYWVGGAGKIYHDRFPDCTPWDALYPYPYWENGQRQAGAFGLDPQPANLPISGIRGAGEFDWGAVNGEMVDERVAAWTVAQLQAQQGEQPFFLACGFYRPHLPWYVPPQYFEPFPLEEIILPEIREDDLEDVPPVGVAIANRPSNEHAKVLARDQYRQAVQGYLASIYFMDAMVGRVLNGLAQSRHRQNTIVALWSDHGWHLGEKLHWKKFTLWEEATRVPLILSVPGLGSGQCDRPVSLLDLYPTLADLCQLPNTPPLDGQSLTPLLVNPQTPWERPALTLWDGHFAVRSDRYRYIRYQDGSEELYDHQTDPNEWINRANDPSLAPVKARLAPWMPTTRAAAAPEIPHRSYGCTPSNATLAPPP